MENRDDENNGRTPQLDATAEAALETLSREFKEEITRILENWKADRDAAESSFFPVPGNRKVLFR